MMSLLFRIARELIYVSAEKYNLTIVSFDRTPKGRKTPAEIIERRY